MNVIAEPPLQIAQLDLHLLTQLQIERAERLVEQQHLRLVDQRPSQRHALLLSARELRRPPILESAQLHEIQHFPGTRRSLGETHPAHARPVRHVLQHTVMCGNSA